MLHEHVAEPIDAHDDGAMNWTVDDIILAFIREFAGGAENMLGKLTQEQARERVRLSIWRNDRARRPFHDSGLSYLDAYRKAYGISAELREKARESSPLFPEADDDEDEEFGDGGREI
jgi:hypothetical protein